MTGLALGSMRALLLFVLLLGTAGPDAISATGHWQPPGIRATTTTLGEVWAKARMVAPPIEMRESYQVSRTSGPSSVTTTLLERGADFLAQTRIGTAVYETGRSAGARWSRGPTGLVRLTGADITNDDDLDRWPVALFPIAAADCTLIGEVDNPTPAWVLRYEPHGDAPRWLYIDEVSGAVMREIVRDGIRVVTTAFDPHPGSDRPSHWTISGSEHDLDVSLVSGVASNLANGPALTIPTSRGVLVTLPPGATSVPAKFIGPNIFVSVQIGDRTEQFALDTGTSDIEIDRLAAIRRGMSGVFDHLVVPEMRVGDLRLRNVPIVTAAGLSGGEYSGLLGYDFFAGHIVHIDYRRARVELYPRSGFTEPAGATRLATDYSEGVPLVTARIGTAVGHRFLLDTGSPRVVIARYFAERDGQPRDTYGITGPPGPVHSETYLEGNVFTRAIKLGSIELGTTSISDDNAGLEDRDDATIDTSIETPFDGIIGTDVMARFEWWFDYDGGQLWLRPTIGMARPLALPG